MAAKMISERLDFIKRNQRRLKADSFRYIHLEDSVFNDANKNDSNIRQYVMLSRSRTMKILVNKKPKLFLLDILNQFFKLFYE